MLAYPSPYPFIPYRVIGFTLTFVPKIILSRMQAFWSIIVVLLAIFATATWAKERSPSEQEEVDLQIQRELREKGPSRLIIRTVNKPSKAKISPSEMLRRALNRRDGKEQCRRDGKGRCTCVYNENYRPHTPPLLKQVLELEGETSGFTEPYDYETEVWFSISDAEPAAQSPGAWSEWSETPTEPFDPVEQAWLPYIVLNTLPDPYTTTLADGTVVVDTGLWEAPGIPMLLPR
jgi:hypothetical protein